MNPFKETGKELQSAQIRVNLRFESQVGPLNEIELNLFSYHLLKLSVKPTKIVHAQS